MWILKPPVDVKSKGSYAYKSNFVWKDDTLPIYIMDNHLSASWCWIQECDSSSHYNFCHIDRHHDLAAIGDISVLDDIRGIKVEYGEYIGLNYNNGDPSGSSYQSFRWDNYIRNTHYLYPNWFHTNLFYVQQGMFEDPHYIRFPIFKSQRRDTLLVRQELTQFIEEPSTCLGDGFLEPNMRQEKWILNIDLDFIWDEDHVRIFDDEFITDLAKRIKNALSNIQVVTIALSPECVAGEEIEDKWDNSLRVLKLFTDELELDFSLDSL